MIIKLKSRIAPAFYVCFSLYSLPHSTIESNIGLRLNPTAVKEYSTLGGTSAYTFLLTNLSDSICLKLLVNTFCVIPVTDLFNSLNLLVPVNKSLTIRTFHLSFIRLNVTSTGQAGNSFLINIHTPNLFLILYFYNYFPN